MAEDKPKTSYLPETRDPLLGATVAGRYLVVRKLGEGGMGGVYLAQHTVLEKPVALKVLHAELSRKPDLVERFMQEAKAASRIRHEHVIDISDFGTTPEGLVFFAMELLSGHDLHEEIARARKTGELLPWVRTKKIFLQICAALSAAHARGVIHRDLKPENVYLVEWLGDKDFVKLLDFGIAKLTEVTSEEAGRKLTKTGMLFGTPEYMSPEQARGESVDHRVDVYAMGCILFQLVCGRVPFEADSFMGILSLHLTEPPPRIAPEVYDHIGAPRELAEVIARALEKSREARWQTIDELAAAVREACGDPVGEVRGGPAGGTVSVERRREPTGRQGGASAEWTGKVRVAEIMDERPPSLPASRAPLRIGVVLALVVGAGAVFLAMRGGKHGGEAASGAQAGGSAAGSAAVVAGSGSAEAVPAPVPGKATSPAREAPAMNRAKIERGEKAEKAEKAVAKKATPARKTAPASKTAGAGKEQKAEAGSGPLAEPDAVGGSDAMAGVVTHPDVGPATGKGTGTAAGTGSGTGTGTGTGTGEKKAGSNCKGDEPCLKGFGSGS